MANPAYPLDAATRKDAQAWAVEYFAQNYDPYWRAVLIEGLLTLMRNRPGLAAAAESASGIGFGQDEQYVHGTAARGLVAAGANELAMQCEDLFQAPDRLRGHLAALFERRLLLRVEFVPGDVDLVEVAALAWRIADPGLRSREPGRRRLRAWP